MCPSFEYIFVSFYLDVCMYTCVYGVILFCLSNFHIQVKYICVYLVMAECDTLCACFVVFLFVCVYFGICIFNSDCE